MKIFVTGATGYIGSHLVKALLEKGHEVHALCRSAEKASNLMHEHLRVFVGDLDNIDVIDEAMRDCQQVFHVAAFARVWDKDPGVFYRINVEGTRNVLDACVKHQVQKVVFTSTAGVYGASFGQPVTESFIRRLDFFNEYEGSKCLAESWVKDFVTHGLDVVIVSPTRVYGPYFLGEVESVTRMIKSYVQKGWRWVPGQAGRIGNYVFIDDVIDGHLKAMEKGRTGETYILGGENQTYGEFFKALADVSGIHKRMIRLPLVFIYFTAYLSLWAAQLFHIAPGITPKWVAKARYDWEVSPEKMITELGIKPTSLSIGLEKTVSWLNT